MLKNAGVWAGSFFLGISLIFIVTSMQYAYTSVDAGGGLGPRFFPFWLCVMMGILSIVYIIQSIKHPVYFSVISPDKRGMFAIAKTILTIILYLLIVRTAGFIITFTLLLFISFRGYFKVWVNMAASLGITMLLYAVFILWLGIPLPVNVFGW
jgi:putative tricarboxylic transport membrane protein